MSRLYLVSEHEVRDGQAAALRRVLEEDFPLGERVVLESERRAPAQEGASGTVLSRSEGTNEYTAKVNTTGSMLLVLSDRWYPGWKATVNGRNADVLRANGVFRAVEVPAGVSDVEFRFLPRSLLLGAAVSLFGLAALATLWRLAGSRVF